MPVTVSTCFKQLAVAKISSCIFISAGGLTPACKCTRRSRMQMYCKTLCFASPPQDAKNNASIFIRFGSEVKVFIHEYSQWKPANLITHIYLTKVPTRIFHNGSTYLCRFSNRLVPLANAFTAEGKKGQ
jgi:hypothetical protein